MRGKARERREIILTYIDQAHAALTKQMPMINVTADKRGKSGGVAQLGEHLPCKQGVRSSILLVSTRIMLDLEN